MAPHSAQQTQSRRIRPPQGAGYDGRSGRSRSKSHTRYEQFDDDEEETGSQKVQITDLPQIKEGTPILRRTLGRQEQTQEMVQDQQQK